MSEYMVNNYCYYSLDGYDFHAEMLNTETGTYAQMLMLKAWARERVSHRDWHAFSSGTINCIEDQIKKAANSHGMKWSSLWKAMNEEL